MDIVDSQVHLGPGGADKMLAAMDAIGIQSVLIDEWWMGTPGDPGYRVGKEGRGFRTTSPTAELAAWTYPGRFSYLIRVDRLDPEMPSVVRLARDCKHVRALRISPGMSRTELGAFAAGELDGVFAAAADHGFPIFVQTWRQYPFDDALSRKISRSKGDYLPLWYATRAAIVADYRPYGGAAGQS